MTIHEAFFEMPMSQLYRQSECTRPQTNFWMRAVSFAGLHRILKVVADSPCRSMTAGTINKLVLQGHISLTQRNPSPALTTVYHYRNALLQLGVFRREGKKLHLNDDDPDVFGLSSQPAPANEDQSLSDDAKDHFSALVLKNEQCRTLFFDLFMLPDTDAITFSTFRQEAIPVKWTWSRSSGTKEAIFTNRITGRTARYSSRISIIAVLYGLRYWARNELGLIDEYHQRSDGSMVMFPVVCATSFEPASNSPVLETVHLLLSLRTPSEWTILSIIDLIAECCVARRRPVAVLLQAIDWLTRNWPYHTVLIPTSRALATLTATSIQRENLELQSYYKVPNGPYVSHIRVHRDVKADSMEVEGHHVGDIAKTKA